MTILGCDHGEMACAQRHNGAIGMQRTKESYFRYLIFFTPFVNNENMILLYHIFVILFFFTPLQ